MGGRADPWQILKQTSNFELLLWMIAPNISSSNDSESTVMIFNQLMNLFKISISLNKSFNFEIYDQYFSNVFITNLYSIINSWINHNTNISQIAVLLNKQIDTLSA